MSDKHPTPSNESRTVWAGACALAAKRHPNATWPQPADVEDARTVLLAAAPFPGAQPEGHCRTCARWQQDDDGDGRGACSVLLNDPAARGWRTLPGYGCNEWVRANG